MGMCKWAEEFRSKRSRQQNSSCSLLFISIRRKRFSQWGKNRKRQGPMLQKKRWTQPIYLILPSTWEIICHILPTFIFHKRENNLSYTLAQGVWQQAVTPSREVLVLSLFLHVFPLPSPTLHDEIFPPCTFSLLHSPKRQYWQHYLEMVINQPTPAASTKTHFLFEMLLSH